MLKIPSAHPLETAPPRGTRYFFIKANFDIGHDVWLGDKSDRAQLYVGNAFSSFSDAQEWADYFKEKIDLKRREKK